MSDTSDITAAINAKFANPVVITLTQAKTATTDYIVIFLSRRYVADRYVSGEVTIPGGRVVVRCVCSKEANVDVFRARVAAALENQILPSGLGPFVFETEDVTDPNSDLGSSWFVSNSSWTY